MNNKINKKDIEKLERWDDYDNLEFDFIYIVPTNQKSNGYKLAYYIGKIGDDIKILDLYDCGSIFSETKDIDYFMLNWDFENIYGGIKFWRNGGKLKYEGGGRINPIKKVFKIFDKQNIGQTKNLKNYKKIYFKN